MTRLITFSMWNGDYHHRITKGSRQSQSGEHIVDDISWIRFESVKLRIDLICHYTIVIVNYAWFPMPTFFRSLPLGIIYVDVIFFGCLSSAWQKFYSTESIFWKTYVINFFWNIMFELYSNKEQCVFLVSYCQHRNMKTIVNIKSARGW